MLNSIGTKMMKEMLETGKYKTLVIRSFGGEVNSAIELGSAIHRHGLDVVVRKACFSSCANYIFTAGKHKTIEDESYVMWHGDARQRNFVEGMDALAARETSTGVDQLTQQERDGLAYSRKSIKAQDDFYAEVGVNGRVSRIGHELEMPVQQWLLSAKEMSSFGIKDVSAPENYGTPEYCEARRYKDPFFTEVSCLQVPGDDVAGTASHTVVADFYKK